jgi:myo-inositol-1(or 4)-monophosphatase
MLLCPSREESAFSFVETLCPRAFQADDSTRILAQISVFLSGPLLLRRTFQMSQDSSPAVTAAELEAAVAATIALVRQVARDEVMPRFLHVQRQLKNDGTLFSEADLAAEKFLAARLPDVLPSPVIGEEMPRAAQQAAWDTGQRGLWCVDPIDGTTNFINGLPLFAISVAWLEGGQSRLGVTFNPFTDEMFYAWAGGGAWLNGQRLPLRESSGQLKRGLANIDLMRMPRSLADRIALAPPFYSQRNFGSSTLEWCYLAAGRLDLYLHGGQMLWDYAAGRIILAEAGGQACTLESLASADFDAGSPWQRSVVAALHPQVFVDWCGWLAAAGADQA